MRTRESGVAGGQARSFCRAVAALVLAAAITGSIIGGAIHVRAERSLLQSWTVPQTIPIAKSNGTPALVEYKGLLYAAWSGNSSPTHVWYASYNGTSWSAQATVPMALTVQSQTPALAIYNGEMYLVWIGHTSPYQLWYSAFNGTTWSSQAMVPSALTTLNAAPGLAGFGGRLYLGWIGKSPNTQFWYSSFNGTKWTAQKTIPSAGLPVTVGADTPFAVYNTKLYACWETGALTALACASFDGSTWSGVKSFSAPSLAGPALAVQNKLLYACWFPNASTTLVTYASFNGTKWSSSSVVPQSRENQEMGPALAAFNGSLVAAWRDFNNPVIDYSFGP